MIEGLALAAKLTGIAAVIIAIAGLHILRVRVLRRRWEWEAAGRVQIAVRSAIQAEHGKRLHREGDD